MIGALVILIIANVDVIKINSLNRAFLSTIGVVVYICSFVMGFGPVPNILCSEIFPTRVRGLSISICSFAYWTGDIIVTYTFPVLLTYIGLAGVFCVYAVVCVVSWVFVYLKVPETKGLPLELISELFVVKQQQVAKKQLS